MRETGLGYVGLAICCAAGLAVGTYGAPPRVGDVDFSGEVDAIDVQLAVNSVLGISVDQDSDGLANTTELRLGTNSALMDTDDDGYSDFREVVMGWDPLTHGAGTSGDGTFAPATYYSIDANPYGITADRFPQQREAVGDFNTDGIPDLASVVSEGVSLTLSDGSTGNKVAGPFFAGGEALRALTVGDFNGDSRLDVCGAFLTTSYHTVVLLGDGKGGLGGAIIRDIESYGSVKALGAVDIDSNGQYDLVVAKGTGWYGIETHLSVGDGTFETAVSYDMLYEPQNILTADLNSDGVTDVIALMRSTTIAVLVAN